jgi:hypothetical protein
MNYIYTLQKEFAATRDTLREKDDIIFEFRTHLAGPKFAGQDPDGSRRDWIATADVLIWLARISAVDVPPPAVRQSRPRRAISADGRNILDC